MQSTRSNYTVSDTAAVLQGIAPDGGLFVDPDVSSRPFDVAGCLQLPYTGMAEKIFSHLLPGFCGKVHDIVSVYPGKFSSEKITPLTKVGESYALFITAAKEIEGIQKQISILTATSGDTGKAALEGFHDVPGTDITVFFPDDGVSPMQKAQMVTQEGCNVRVCAVRGNFDDCQRGVKEAFACFAKTNREESDRLLSSANSINIGRLVPQIVYYVWAYTRLLRNRRISSGDEVNFVVPTGNFGDILAGYLAREMGLPVGRLVCASNANNVLTDFISTGVYNRCRPFLKTSSPSMDILVSSNLERMLFYASLGDTSLVSSLMKSLNTEGTYTLSGEPLKRIQSVFFAGCCSEAETSETIARLWHEHHWLSDTHTAVGFAVLDKYRADPDFSGNPCVVLSTASPFKFPATGLSAIGGIPSADEFETAFRLSEKTGIQVPQNIADLRKKPVLHTDLIDKSEVVSYALS